MLNELSLLARSLAAKGLSVESWDSRIKPFKKGPAYVARLGADGRVASLEWLDKEKVEGLRRISPQNEKSFPGFNLNHSILEINPEWFDEVNGLWERIVSSIDMLPLAGETSDRRAIDGNLRYPDNELKSEFAGDDVELRPTRTLIERISGLSTEDFLSGLGRAAIQGVKEGVLDQDAAELLLYGKFNKKKGATEPAKVTLILDVDDAAQLGGRVASIESASAWNRALLAGKKSTEGTKILCSLSGSEDFSIGEKMPQPNLPGLGLTYLMSMNKATPCQTRYGMTSTAVYPIGQQCGQRLSDALQFITNGGREGKTFSKVPNASSDSSDLLVAYLEDEPESSLPVVDMFADLMEAAEPLAAVYEQRTSNLLQALRNEAGPKRDAAVRIFALTKLDPGRSQVLFSGRYSLDELEAGLNEWFHGMRNLPEIRIYFGAGKGHKSEWRSPAKPSPIQVLRSFKSLWLRGGNESSPVPGVDLAQIYGLMLERDRGLAAPLLNRILHLSEALLCALGGLRQNVNALPARARQEGLIILPLLGLLLLKLGQKKEGYMDSREFLLGQFLQLADRLHKLYCEEVRKGAVPPQLAGNAALGGALQNPERAFQSAGQRIRVYVAWADTCSGEKAGVARWLRRLIGDVCLRLSKQDGLPVRIDDRGKAKLFLGYLAELNNKEQSA